MSALYLGTGKLEQYLVERLENKLQTNPSLKMNILLDYMRGTRTNREGQSSLSLLKPLKEKHLLRPTLRLGFWHHPDTGFFKGKYFSGPMKEIFGVHHMKAHVFDHNVMITGGNLYPLPQYAHPYKDPKKYKNQMGHHLRFFRFSGRTQIPTDQDLKIEDYFSEQDPTSQKQDDDVPLLDLSKSRPFTSKPQSPITKPPNDTSNLAAEEQVLIEHSNLGDEYILNKIVESSKNKTQNKDEGGRVFIFPTLQMNVINYREDEQLFLQLLKYFSKVENGLARLKMATGYFNLQKEFIDLLNKNPILKTEVLTSSPRANGFYKAGRFKKYIPGMYRVNELNVLEGNKSQGNISIHEYEHGEWTYHAKGAWLYEQDQPEVPQMTVVGSSNYSYRSNRRDTEAQLYIVSECEEFKKRMHEECEHLFKHSTKMSIETVKNDGQDKITLTEKVLNRLLKILL